MKCENTSHGHITEVDALTCGYEREIKRLKAQVEELQEKYVTACDLLRSALAHGEAVPPKENEG